MHIGEKLDCSGERELKKRTVFFIWLVFFKEEKFDVIKIKYSDRKVIKFLISSHKAIKYRRFFYPCRRVSLFSSHKRKIKEIKRKLSVSNCGRFNEHWCSFVAANRVIIRQKKPKILKCMHEIFEMMETMKKACMKFGIILTRASVQISNSVAAFKSSNDIN